MSVLLLRTNPRTNPFPVPSVRISDNMVFFGRAISRHELPLKFSATRMLRPPSTVFLSLWRFLDDTPRKRPRWPSSNSEQLFLLHASRIIPSRGQNIRRQEFDVFNRLFNFVLKVGRKLRLTNTLNLQMQGDSSVQSSRWQRKPCGLIVACKQQDVFFFPRPTQLTPTGSDRLGDDLNPRK